MPALTRRDLLGGIAASAAVVAAGGLAGCADGRPMMLPSGERVVVDLGEPRRVDVVEIASLNCGPTTTWRVRGGDGWIDCPSADEALTTLSRLYVEGA